MKQSTGSERAWGVWQAVLAVAIVGLFTAFVSYRDDLIVATAFATETAPAVHRDQDGRLKHLERPEALLQLAQATKAVEKVEAAADLAAHNAAAIGVIQNDLEHMKGSGDRRERMLEAMLDKIDRLGVRTPGS
jgi:hypothetical protein